MTAENKNKQRIKAIVILYPIAVLVVALVLNWFVFGVNAPIVVLPPLELLVSYGLAALLIVINHSWLMTSTELTRLRYSLHATPEEWAANARNPEDASEEGRQELARRHNAHRNATENTVYFLVPAFLMLFIAPTLLAAQVWVVGFAMARLGYSYSYLRGNDGLRGLFMTLSLLALYGMAGYLAMALGMLW